MATIVVDNIFSQCFFLQKKEKFYFDRWKLNSRINNVTYIDNSIEFIDLSGAINNDLMPDNLHLSKKGYEKLSKVLTPLIYRLVPKLRISNGDE